ncbi:D-alanyl-D-alanine carboxypeptidase precursor [Legionella massiliensis]|uniref:D-alanyl-D-alanine carboxypeptidase n=1 Tax=Legionella massiliensis TaxID=1034943 RepID=A0A078KYS9_9GAMM|nr:serine hydrolase domain-containing protein [Legionella massiliensis]CDZ78222.1 D-alanyl-D-alanine carboxypeptidase precursor [Legionella massiliensis]CEE13960.1 D-alanyl-D-alanine carboxypeptidase precursor [Legionella massiliensis]
MCITKKKNRLVALGISAVLLGFSLPALAKEPAINPLLQDQLDQLREQYHISGMALTVIAPQLSPRPLNFMSGKTRKVRGRPIITSDFFQIGSNTKSFVAAILLKLQSEKRLSLDDPLSKWLPQYADKWGEVTVRHLLHNNSGIPSYSKNQKFLRKFEREPNYQYSNRELVSYAYDDTHPESKAVFKAGQGWYYSNTNWVLAGMVAEKAGKLPFEKLLKKYITSSEKNNLSNTRYINSSYSRNTLNRLVHGYSDEGEDVTGRNASWASTAGAILQSNEDLAYWAYELFHGNVLNKEDLSQMQQLVSTETGKEIPNTTVNPQGYGLGIGLKRIDAGPYWGHEGHTEGYHSSFAFFPEDDITITINASGLENSNFETVMQNIVHSIREAQSDLHSKA